MSRFDFDFSNDLPDFDDEETPEHIRDMFDDEPYETMRDDKMDSREKAMMEEEKHNN
jgi:hypothetical protein